MLKGLKWPLLILSIGLLLLAVVGQELWLPWASGLFGGEDRVANGSALTGSVQPKLDDETEEGSNEVATSLRDNDLEAAARRNSGSEAGIDSEAGGGRDTSADPASVDMGKDKRADEAAEKAAKEATQETAEEVVEEEPPVPIETVEGQQINPNLGGALGEVSNKRIHGWVQDKFEPEADMFVEIQIDDVTVYELRASKRVDHKKLGVIWYFEQKQPEQLQDAEKHVVRALVYRKDQHGKTELRGSPRAKTVGAYPRGKLEEATPEKGISGYAWDPDTKDKPVQVVVRIDGETIAELTANVKNEELKKRKIAPTEACAFNTTWPGLLDDGLDHTVQVFAVDTDDGTEHELDGSPRVVNARSGLANEAPFGGFDICNKVVLAGWAWDPDVATGSIDVEVWIDNELFAQVPANSKRDTLRNSKVTPDPYHGFVTTTPTALLDGGTHTVRVYAVNYPSGVKVELNGSPKQYRLEENTPPMGGFWRADDNTLRGWAADPDLNSEPCDIEIYIDGKLWEKQKADRREDWLIGSGFAPNAEHGFAIKPPDFVKDGEEHEVRILAINYPDGAPKDLGTRTIGVSSTFPGFWTSDKLLDTRVSKGLYVSGVSPWYDAYHKDVKVGDVLLEYDGIEAGTAEKKDKDGKVTQEGTMTTHFRVWLNTNKQKNDVVRFKFWRDGETYEVDIKMGEIIGK
ncbi:MAG: hypothetical protein KDB68_03135 [Planctomycetes bacterium]|nr:hypothetical protein [Planctomycetota bacterium]MCA8935174.1 hypothetical protein [Planctomycetota bacterium]